MGLEVLRSHSLSMTSHYLQCCPCASCGVEAEGVGRDVAGTPECRDHPSLAQGEAEHEDVLQAHVCT